MVQSKGSQTVRHNLVPLTFTATLEAHQERARENRLKGEKVMSSA